MKSTPNEQAPAASGGQAAADETQTGALIRAALSLSQAIESLSRANLLGGPGLPDVRSGLSFYEQVSRFESALILEALRVARGRQREAAALLGLKPTTFNTMLKRHGIASADFAAHGGAGPHGDASEQGAPREAGGQESRRRPSPARETRRTARPARDAGGAGDGGGANGSRRPSKARRRGGVRAKAANAAEERKADAY
jgi:hypothetical protein